MLIGDVLSPMQLRKLPLDLSLVVHLVHRGRGLRTWALLADAGAIVGTMTHSPARVRGRTTSGRTWLAVTVKSARGIIPLSHLRLFIRRVLLSRLLGEALQRESSRQERKSAGPGILTRRITLFAAESIGD